MILFYVDESGTSLGDHQVPYFILTSVAISTNYWKMLDDQITTLKHQWVSWAKPEDFEIKGRDMRRGEKFFKSFTWNERISAMHQVAELIANLPCTIFAVQVDKRDLPEYINSDDQLYRIALYRLLDKLESHLESCHDEGLLMLDTRSTLHSSLQDRRLLDSYRAWLLSKSSRSHFIELPWFGFSAFYAGLQLADFAAYLFDYVSNEANSPNSPLHQVYHHFQTKMDIIRIP